MVLSLFKKLQSIYKEKNKDVILYRLIKKARKMRDKLNKLNKKIVELQDY